jgi:hypothetical protein
VITRDPLAAIRSRVVAHLLATMEGRAQPAILPVPVRSRTPPLSRLLSHRLTSMRSTGTFVRLNANSPNISLKRINPR